MPSKIFYPFFIVENKKLNFYLIFRNRLFKKKLVINKNIIIKRKLVFLPKKKKHIGERKMIWEVKASSDDGVKMS